jgi:hypothetical protein
MQRLKYRLIACDFDGTIAYENYPNIGDFKPDAVRVLRKFLEYGGKLIIWTCRTGEQAEKVKQKLLDAEVRYHAFNDNLEEDRQKFPDNSRKVYADIYIDDRANFLEEINWLWIESKLFEEVGEGEQVEKTA